MQWNIVVAGAAGVTLLTVILWSVIRRSTARRRREARERELDRLRRFGS